MKDIEKKQPKIVLTKGKETFESWAERPYIGSELKDRIRASQVLLVPQEGFRSHAGPVFSAGTIGFFQYLQENMPKEFSVEICIEDDDFNEVLLHDITVILGSLYVSMFVAPVVVNLVSEYLKLKMLSSTKDAEPEIKIEMEVQLPDSSSKKIKYSGPASEFQKIMGQNLNKIEAIEIDDKNEDDSNN